MQTSQEGAPHEVCERDSETKPTYDHLNPGELQVIIDTMWDNPPEDKRTKPYKEHKAELNKLIDLYNKKVGFKAYKQYE